MSCAAVFAIPELPQGACNTLLDGPLLYEVLKKHALNPDVHQSVLMWTRVLQKKVL